ncbi:hypothetical protein PY365_28700 [Roseiarcaceae bacterium H3SJ34-1]|uniref:hypothetical protein n=1 Tax=Terripilifer ovatus TaxID=3032367 RepID=UPI003AB9B6F5|nr:hypothetical protein [Roseiarcaceae bacterium H3SJ34-1]
MPSIHFDKGKTGGGLNAARARRSNSTSIGRALQCVTDFLLNDDGIRPRQVAQPRGHSRRNCQHARANVPKDFRPCALDISRRNKLAARLSIRQSDLVRALASFPKALVLQFIAARPAGRLFPDVRAVPRHTVGSIAARRDLLDDAASREVMDCTGRNTDQAGEFIGRQCVRWQGRTPSKICKAIKAKRAVLPASGR